MLRLGHITFTGVKMTDPHWPFPTKEHPLTPPKPPEYLDYALKVETEIRTKVITEDALL